MRLEQENDGLARELVTSKVTLRTDLDTVSMHTYITVRHSRELYIYMHYVG